MIELLIGVITKIEKYFRSCGDVSLFLGIAVTVGVLPFYLRKSGLDEILKKLTSENKKKRSIDVVKLTVFTNWWLNRKFAMFQPTCLKRSLVLYKYLSGAAMPVKIFYGIKKNKDGENEGHSWVTLDGVKLWPDGAVAHEYAVTFSYPSDDISK